MHIFLTKKNNFRWPFMFHQKCQAKDGVILKNIHHIFTMSQKVKKNIKTLQMKWRQFHEFFSFVYIFHFLRVFMEYTKKNTYMKLILIWLSITRVYILLRFLKKFLAHAVVYSRNKIHKISYTNLIVPLYGYTKFES